MTETILEIKNLKKSYGKNEVLKDISLSVKKRGGYLNYWFFRFREINLPSLY